MVQLFSAQQRIYRSSTLFLAQGVFLKKVRLDLMLG